MSLPSKHARFKAPQRPARGAIDWFLMAMVAAVLVASFMPQWGRSEGVLHLGKVTDVGVFLLFFLHGMGLSTDSLKQGATRWKLHLLVQSCTYVLFPLWWALLAATAGRWMPHDLLMGFFYLAVLPSTVSSSVAMTALARGHVAAAVLNATLSTLLGVFLTPLLVSLVMGSSGELAGHKLDVGATMLKVAQMLLLPFVIGHLLRPALARTFARIKPITTVFDRGVIVLLVWSAFSDSVADGLWSRHGAGLLAQAVVGVLAAHAGLHALGGSPPGFFGGRRDRGRVLRLQENAGLRHAHGQAALWRQCSHGGLDPADHAVPPAPAVRLCGDGAALCRQGLSGGA
jgi:sodium/bile acid cotransporter 7